MRLDVKRIINTPGDGIEFNEEFDLSDVDFGGVCPAVRPVSVVGTVRNIAGMLRLRFDLDTELSCVCDRCGVRIEKPFHVELERMLATELEDEENDEILLLEDGGLELDELARETYILNMDTKTLCREDCKGLCPGCGANLNIEECHCKKETDPRWAELQKLL
ncbi:MAG: DUF177 domain-containing protein [Oscillospiraceae bacterium]|nr:DUF177 domain-containing protein [Oscillospiraceae bacterium]